MLFPLKVISSKAPETNNGSDSEPILEPEPLPEPTPEPIKEPIPEPAPESLEATFSSIHKLILVPKCASCHNPSSIRPREDYTDFRSTLTTGKIIPGNAEGSEIYKECSSGNMPIGSAPLTATELTVLKAWINNGAQDN